MLNPDQKLNPKLFDRNVECATMRQGFGDGLSQVAEIDERVVGLCADLADSVYMDRFRSKFPDRYVEVGVAEQNLVTVASGMAAMSKIPFIGSYAIFSPGRNWEQIRTTVCYNNRPVKIIGSHTGVSVGPDGGSHQALEDIAIMRTLPRMVVISPCDAMEAKKATMSAAKTDMPTYIRLSRDKTPIITSNESTFEIGKASILFRSENMDMKNQKSIINSTRNKINEEHRSTVGIVATGELVYRALLAARKLDAEGVSVCVMNLSTIKPLDEQAITKLAHEYRHIVTVEDHQVAGGMGSAVAEFLAQHVPVPIEFVGVKDKFGQSGTPEELIKHYGLDEKSIFDASKRVMLRG